MRRFFIPETVAKGATAIITGSDARHIRNVLRMKPGDPIFLFDGYGSDYHAKIVALSANRIEVVIKEKHPSKTESPTEIILAQAVLKDRKLDEIIRQITELGVTTVIPFLAHRSVSRPDPEKFAARRIRWQKIAREALKQCGRSQAPDIRDVVSFEEMLAQTRTAGTKILFWENEPIPLTPGQVPSGPKTVAVIMGPEGGFTKEEVAQAASFGYQTAGLGPRILKADTATVTACALVQYLLGDMGKIYS